MISKALLFGVFAMLLANASAAVDCAVRPNFKDTYNCCHIPDPQWPSSCAQFIKRNKPNPCLVECIFNASNVMEGEKVNPNNLRTLLTQLFPGQNEFVDAYAMSINKCEPLVQQKMTEMKANGQPMPQKFGNDNCNHLPMVLAMCATREVFLNCPAKAWTATPVCENAKEYIRTCEPENGGMFGGHGGGHGGGRGGRMTAKRGLRGEGYGEQN